MRGMPDERHHLTWLLAVALLPRILAAIFSQGYFAHDDHFLVIEAAQSWVDAADYNNWLPWNQGPNATPSGHSFLYVGLHYLLFASLKALGANDPKLNMVVVRLLHALWSLLVVAVGYRIARRLSGPAVAWRAGLLLALFYFMPFLAVRNLVEVVCIPFLMLTAWYLIRDERGPQRRDVLLAGIFIGLAMNIRFQTIFFAAAPGLVFLFRRSWTNAIVYAAGILVPLALIQGSIDLYLWGRPFAELTEYVRYNLEHTTTYFDQPWYNYLLLLAGIFIPPLSVAVLFGLFRRSTPILAWLPVILFLAVHSYFPNKQERFLLPIVPLAFVLGYCAWEEWRMQSTFWRNRPQLWKGCMVFVHTLNVLLLLVLTFSYSKRSRVEAMWALRQEGPVSGMIVEDSVEGDPPMMPLYYLGQWHLANIPYDGRRPTDLESLVRGLPDRHFPNTVVFIGPENMDQRIQAMERLVGPLQLVTKAEPGFVDRVVHWLNPVNRNETIGLYRTVGDRN
ncbi:MAG: glycosyltransferase family 39 protein [Flavobacteriales bacterium]|nr:glycosyltransferase family 39 protein [Flavobacteriales bacterium]